VEETRRQEPSLAKLRGVRVGKAFLENAQQELASILCKPPQALSVLALPSHEELSDYARTFGDRHTPTSRYGRVRMPSFKVRALICAHHHEEGLLAMEKHIIDICEFYHGRICYSTMLDKYFAAQDVCYSNDDKYIMALLPEAQWSLTGREMDNFSFRWN
jgi:hypothetical protein